MVRVRRPRPECTISDADHAINLAEFRRQNEVLVREHGYEGYYRAMLAAGWTDEELLRLLRTGQKSTPRCWGLFRWLAHRHGLDGRRGQPPSDLAALAKAYAEERAETGAPLSLARVEPYEPGWRKRRFGSPRRR